MLSTYLIFLPVNVAMAEEARGEPIIWLGPQFGARAAIDLMKLYEPDAHWQIAASHVSVFAISGEVVQQDSHVDLRRMLNDLGRRHIAIELGIAPLSGYGRCGHDVEGYSAPGQPLSDAQRLKTEGAVINDFSMDEPLHFGHIYSGRNACHDSISDIAKEVAIKIKGLQAVYPNVPIGDVEPVASGQKDWLRDLNHWFDAFEANTGQKLAFFRADIQWSRHWQDEMDGLRALLSRKGIPLQVIYNGNGDTNEDWVATAVRHIQRYESGGRPPPDVAVIQSWDRNPTHLLPESDPVTLTGLVDWYVLWRQSNTIR